MIATLQILHAAVSFQFYIFHQSNFTNNYYTTTYTFSYNNTDNYKQLHDCTKLIGIIIVAYIIKKRLQESVNTLQDHVDSDRYTSVLYNNVTVSGGGRSPACLPAPPGQTFS